jgi:DNA-binding MarR family transcriptional regulator
MLETISILKVNMKLETIDRQTLGALVDSFMRAMHTYDFGRTLQILHASGLSTPQLAVLELARTAQTVSAVARHLALSLPATSQLIDRLVRGRWLRRIDCKTDRRQRLVVLRLRGKTLLDELAAARAARFASALVELPGPVANRFQSILVTVTNALGNKDLGSA